MDTDHQNLIALMDQLGGEPFHWLPEKSKAGPSIASSSHTCEKLYTMNHPPIPNPYVLTTFHTQKEFDQELHLYDPLNPLPYPPITPPLHLPLPHQTAHPSRQTTSPSSSPENPQVELRTPSPPPQPSPSPTSRPRREKFALLLISILCSGCWGRVFFLSKQSEKDLRGGRRGSVLDFVDNHPIPVVHPHLPALLSWPCMWKLWNFNCL